MLDPVFLRPIAHRGLHDPRQGIIENTGAAFDAAIAGGFGIECDLQPARSGVPIVFHDETLDRLIEGRSGLVRDLDADEAAELSVKGSKTKGVLTYQAFLDLIAGRVPLLVEIKSDWHAPDAVFLETIARLSLAYRGPLALMSFDPGIMARMRELAPSIPRGIVSGAYQTAEGVPWHGDVLSEERRFRLANLLESGPAAPSFYAYDIRSLPTPVTRFVREVLRLPLFSWTVRTEAQRLLAAEHADALIFENL